MQSEMIQETKNEKTTKVWIECLLFMLLFFILEIIKGIFTMIPMFIEMFKSGIFTFTEGEVNIEVVNETIASITSTPSVTITMLFFVCCLYFRCNLLL